MPIRILIRTTVVPIRGVIGTTVVRIRILIGMTVVPIASTDQNSKQMELIIHKSLFSSNFCVDYEGYDIFELWTLSGKLYLL